MAIVLQHGNKNQRITRTFWCANCGCIFKADDQEYKYEMFRNEDYYYCACPECGEKAFSIKEKR